MMNSKEICNFFDRINEKIDLYDKNEKLARQEFPAHALRSFIPTTFSAFNFSTHMSTAYDAWKYLDSQQEFRIGSYFGLDMMGFITDDELAQLAETLNDMACENHNDMNTHEAADKKFHMIIARATHNSAISSVIEELWDERESSALTKRMYQIVRESGVKPSVDEHKKIYDAL